jgi:hypothetical protein
MKAKSKYARYNRPTAWDKDKRNPKNKPTPLTVGLIRTIEDMLIGLRNRLQTKEEEVVFLNRAIKALEDLESI